MATVKLFGNLRDYAPAWVVEAPGATVREVLANLCRGNEDLRDALFDGDRLRPHVRVMIAGRDIELAQGMDTAVADEAPLAIFPPIAGG